MNIDACYKFLIYYISSVRAILVESLGAHYFLSALSLTATVEISEQ